MLLIKQFYLLYNLCKYTITDIMTSITEIIFNPTIRNNTLPLKNNPKVIPKIEPIFNPINRIKFSFCFSNLSLYIISPIKQFYSPIIIFEVPFHKLEDYHLCKRLCSANWTIRNELKFKMPVIRLPLINCSKGQEPVHF